MIMVYSRILRVPVYLCIHVEACLPPFRPLRLPLLTLEIRVVTSPNLRCVTRG